MSRTRLVLLIGYITLIFSLSTRAYVKPPGPEFQYKDKIAHFVEYSVLGALLFSAVGARTGRSRALTFMLLLAIGATVASADEMVQGMVPGRSKDVFDWTADLIGVSVGVAAFMLSGRAAPAGDAGGGAGDGGVVA